MMDKQAIILNDELLKNSRMISKFSNSLQNLIETLAIFVKML